MAKSKTTRGGRTPGAKKPRVPETRAKKKPTERAPSAASPPAARARPPALPRRGTNGLELVPAERPPVRARELEPLKQRLVRSIGYGEWKLATQARLDDSEPVLFGRRGGKAREAWVYTLDPAADKVERVCELLEGEPTQIALLPNDRIAVLWTGRLVLATTAPAYQVLDQIKLDALAVIPVLEGRALVLHGYREEQSLSAEQKRLLKQLDAGSLSLERFEEQFESAASGGGEEIGKLQARVIAVGIYDDALGVFGEVECDSAFEACQRAGRVYVRGRADYELTGLAEAYESGRAQTRARRAQREPFPATHAPVRALAFAGVTERASRAQPLTLPDADPRAQALAGADSWVSPPFGKCVYALLGVSRAYYGKGMQLALVDLEAERLVKVSPEVWCKHCYFDVNRVDRGVLLAAADRDVYEIEIATAQARKVASGGLDVQNLLYAGDLLAVIRFTAPNGSSMALEWLRPDGTLREAFGILGERLALVAGGRVLVSYCVNYGAPSWFFAVEGSEFRLLGYLRTVHDVWDKDGAVFVQDSLGAISELCGLPEAAERALAGEQKRIDLTTPFREA